MVCFTCALPALRAGLLHPADCAAGDYVCTLVLTAEFPKNLDSAVSVIPFPKNYGTISNAVFSLPPSLRPALVHAGMPCGQWVTVQFPNAMPE
jgi:hypothetical protein